MHHAEALRRREHVRDLQDDAHGLLLRLRAAEGDGRAEGVAPDVVHHEEVHAAGVVVTCVMHRHEVGMAYPRGELRLADKPLHILGLLLRDVRIKDLDREQRVEHLMPPEPDRPQPALSDLLFDHVAVERFTRPEHHPGSFAPKAVIFTHVQILCFHRRTV